MVDDLNPKQARFVAEYLKDLNATKAAIRAGYSENSAYSIGSELLSKPEIQNAVSDAQAQALERAELTADRVLEEFRRLAFIDARSFFDDAGNLKPMKDLTPEQGAALASFEVIIKNAQAGDGATDTVHKIRLWDKTKALDSLAKRFGLLVEKIEHSGGLTLKHELPDDSDPV